MLSGIALAAFVLVGLALAVLFVLALTRGYTDKAILFGFAFITGLSPDIALIALVLGAIYWLIKGNLANAGYALGGFILGIVLLAVMGVILGGAMYFDGIVEA